MHDISSSINIVQSLMPQTIQASALSTGAVDTQGADAVAIVVLIGAIADTLSSSARIDLKIEHADDDGTGQPLSFAPCVDANVTNASGLDAAGIFKSVDDPALDAARVVIGYAGGKRFVKVTATPVGLATGGPIAMATLAGALHQKPALNA